jgi:predicted PhzF superfamily epimerase YddE/YHI9
MFYPKFERKQSHLEIGAFFSDQHGTLIEDPVTGSLNASVAQWLFASGRAQGDYIAAQGTRLGRTGRVHVSRDGWARSSDNRPRGGSSSPAANR